jgi:hypothetical protein
VALRHVGVPDEAVGWAEVLFVFASTRLLTAVRFTPGGAGVVEALLIGGLVAAGGQQAEVAAAVLVFRGLTWLLPMPIGGLTTSPGAASRPGGGRRRGTPHPSRTPDPALDDHPAVDHHQPDR